MRLSLGSRGRLRRAVVVVCSRFIFSLSFGLTSLWLLVLVLVMAILVAAIIGSRLLLVCVVVVPARATVSRLIASLVVLWARVRWGGRLGFIGLVVAKVVFVFECLVEAVVLSALVCLTLLLAPTVLRLREWW